MGRAYTVAAKRKAKKDLPELTSIPKRQPNGQARQRADSPTDPRKTALSARCKLFGIPDTKTNRDALSGQHSGSDLGRVMQSECKPHQIPQLWATWQAFCMAERTYRMRIIGTTGDPQGANIAMVPDRMETDQSASVDLRDNDQKNRDAVASYMRWRGYLGQLDARESHLIHRAERDDGPALWGDDGPTTAGKATLAALIRLAKAQAQ